MSIPYISPWIFTTNQCNLRCPYCYVKWDDNKMEKQTYDKINETFLGMMDRGDVDHVIYRLAGGEPTLVFDEWKGFVEDFLDGSKGRGFVTIITNLTKLTDEMLDFFGKHKDRINFGVSLDGYSYSKPFPDGRSSAEIVKRNIDRMLSAGVGDIDISTVVDANSFNDVDVLAEWVSQRHLKWGIYLDHYFCGEMEYDIVCEKMAEVINVLKKNSFDIYRDFKFNNVKLDTNYDGCTAGEKLIAIGTDGGVYPCQTLVGGKPVCNISSCDSLIKAFKEQKIYPLGHNYLKPQKCRECPLAELCGGGCKMHNKSANMEFTCDIIKTVVLYMAEAVSEQLTVADN